MSAEKKIIVGLLCCLSLGAFSQEKVDIGVIISTDHLSRLGLEYRKPLNEQFKWKIGVTGGSEWLNSPNEHIVSATDSTVIMSRFNMHVSQVALRFGVERRLKASIFSVGFDLNLGYRAEQYDRRNFAEGLNGDGQWVFAEILSEEEHISGSSVDPNFDRPIAIGDYGLAHVKRHFLNTDVRLSLNLDTPVGDCFLIHASIAGVFGAPIYMGQSYVLDPENYYIGNPPSIFNFNTNFNVGLRYLLGSDKK